MKLCRKLSGILADIVPQFTGAAFPPRRGLAGAAEPQMKVKTQSAKLEVGCAVRESHKRKSKGKRQK
jgi:hypothetical protein